MRSDELSDDDLREALFNAVAESSNSSLNSLLTRHRDRLAALFPGWTTLPASVRSDSARTKWWADGMIGVAFAAAKLGDGSLMTRLQGPPEDNIVIQWQEAFRAAEADAASGRVVPAIVRLEHILVEAAGLTGSGVDYLLPRTYGLLGTLHYRAGNRNEARELTLKARAYCERTGDHEGAKIYAHNLEIIDRP